MEYVALYRKYRPKKIDQLYGQKYIVEILKNSILNNKFMHAYLFSGPRGTGKTTVAKLIAKIVNCSNLKGFDPCDECDSCKLINDKSNPDIIEIDAASNNGVDEIRIIRDSVVLMPSVSKYKVYIIDEVHMLSTSAFNALLKTIEEPPEHVIFILATTEFNKVPETITSRCQCYDFKRISVNDIVDCLKNIAKKEKIDVEDDVLKLIAEYSNGGMRDSIGLLDKLLSYSNVINRELFYDVVGLVDKDIIIDLYNNIVLCDVNKVYDLVEKLVSKGKSILSITEQLLEYLKEIGSSEKHGIAKKKYNAILNGISEIYNQMRNSFNEVLFFEVEILKLINSFDEYDNVSVEIKNDLDKKEEIKQVENDLDESEDKEKEKVSGEQSFEKINEDIDIIINNAFATANKSLKEDVKSKWGGFNDYVHNKEFSSLVSYFLDSNVEVVGEKDIIISSDYDTVVDSANRKTAKLELLFNLVIGRSYNIAFVTKNQWDKLKEEYVNNIKNGKKYEYIDKNEAEIKEEKIVLEDATSDLSDVINAARDIFGKDVVEVK